MRRGWLALLLSMVVWGQVSPGVSVETEERTAGPFPIGDHSFQLVLTVAKLASAETVSVVQVRDSDGTVSFERKIPYQLDGGRFVETTSVQAEVLGGKGGTGLLLTYAGLPSTPLGGKSWQVLGVAGGKLTPFSPPVALEGSLVGQSPGAPLLASRDEALQVDVLNFRIWTGNFSVIVPLELNWDSGYMRLAYGLVEKCRMLVEANRRPLHGDATVMLYPESDEEAGEPVEVDVRKDSAVDLLWAEGRLLWEQNEEGVRLSVYEDVWLKVRIDGKEGYVHSPDTFASLGLPEAG